MAVSEAHKRASMKYDRENMRQIKFNLSLKYDQDIIAALDAQPNKQGYIKALIRADIARANSEKTKEEKAMMKYTIKPEYIDLWCGSEAEADENTIITEEDVARLAHDWETSEDELKSQLIPVRANSDDDPGIPSGGNPWYAVQRDPEDDWDYDGSFDLEEAKAKARKLREEYPNALIAVIDNSLENPFCIEEIRDF